MCNSVRQLAAADVYIGRVAKNPLLKKTSTPFWSGCYGIVGGIGLVKRRIYADLPDRGQFESRVRSAHWQCVTHSAVGNPPIAHKPSDWHSIVKSNMALKTIIHRKYTVDIDRIQICTKDKKNNNTQYRPTLGPYSMAVARFLATTLWLCCALYRKFLRLSATSDWPVYL